MPFDEDDDDLLDDDALTPDDPSLFDPMGKRDLGAEGMKKGDEAVMRDDPAREMEKIDGEPGPNHGADPDTEGELDELFSHAREVELEEPSVEFDPLDDI